MLANRIKSFASLCVALCFVSQLTEASPIINGRVCDGGTVELCATSIKRLSVDGTHYDVTIVSGAFADLFPDTSQIPFWNDQALALAAVTAMNQAVTAVFGAFGYCAPTNCITNPFLPFEQPDPFTVTILNIPIHTGVVLIDDTLSTQSTNITWASFKVSEPSTLGLLALGLGGLLARRKVNQP